MKKLVTMILVLALLLPSSAFTVVGDSPYFGRWVGVEYHAVSRYSTQLHFIRIMDNGAAAYYVINMIDAGAITSGKIEGEQYVGRWEALDDGTLRVPTSPVTYVDLKLDEDGNLVCKNPKVVFVKVP